MIKNTLNFTNPFGCLAHGKTTGIAFVSKGAAGSCFKWVVLFAFGFSMFGAEGSCQAQQTGNTNSSFQVSNSKRVDDDEPKAADSSPAPLSPPVSPPVDSRIKGIHQRIDILKEIIAKKTAESNELKSKPVPEAETPESTPAKSEAAASLPEKPSKLAAEEPKKESRKSEPVPNANRPPDSVPASKINPLAGLEINTSQINSLELANSLFLTQNYAQALKSYEALLIMDSSELDTAWLRCLTANCYRVQKQYTKAERLYRDVAGFKEKTFPNDHAQWYLNHISRRNKIEAELILLEKELAAFKKEKEEKK